MEKSPPNIIYLLPIFENSGSEYGWIDYVWCEDPAPDPDMDEGEAVQYVRADDRVSLERALERLKAEA